MARVAAGIFSLEIDGPEDDRSVMTMIRRDGNYEPWVMGWMAKLLDPESVVLDIGANVGTLAIYASKWCDRGRVYAFEPHPVLFGFLEQNVVSNAVQNLVAVQNAVGSKNGRQYIRVSRASDGTTDWGGAMVRETGDDASVAVDVVTLDNWIDAHPLTRIDLLKIDVEGSEVSVIEGAAKTIRTFKPTMLVEFYPQKLNADDPRSGHRLIEMIHALGYRIWVIHRFRPRLTPVGSYAALRSMMLTGHGVEDLLCVPAQQTGKFDDASQIDLRATYGAAYSVSFQNGARIIALNAYEDGWLYGREAALIVEGGQPGMTLHVSVAEVALPLRLEVSWRDSWLTEELAPGGQFDFQIAVDGPTTIYFSSDRCMLARDYFRNADPRELSVKMSYSMTADDTRNHSW